MQIKQNASADCSMMLLPFHVFGRSLVCSADPFFRYASEASQIRNLPHTHFGLYIKRKGSRSSVKALQDAESSSKCMLRITIPIRITQWDYPNRANNPGKPRMNALVNHFRGNIYAIRLFGL